MKGVLQVDFSPDELEAIRFHGGRFSFVRFKSVLRRKIRRLLREEYKSQQSAVVRDDMRIGRVVIRGIDPDVPKDFFVDVSFRILGRRWRDYLPFPILEEWRQTYRYILKEPGKSLRGELVPGERH